MREPWDPERPVHVAMASEFVDRERLAGAELVCADARDNRPMPDSFDLVQARTLLINVPDPSAGVSPGNGSATSRSE
jgi:hypothetical protein